MHVKNQTEQKGEIDHATFLQTFLLIFYHWSQVMVPFLIQSNYMYLGCGKKCDLFSAGFIKILRVF